MEGSASELERSGSVGLRQLAFLELVGPWQVGRELRIAGTVVRKEQEGRQEKAKRDMAASG